MKKNILYILLGIFLLASCQQENEIPLGKGYLSVEGIELQSQMVTEVVSRAVDETLIVELWKGDTKIRVLSAQEMQDKIKLEVADDYYLKVYSENYGSESDWDNETKGEPVYYKEETFVVEDGKTTSLKMQVPMITFAVSLDLSEIKGDWLNDYSFVVTSDTRRVSLRDKEIAYFPYSEGAFFSYQLKIRNTDFEEKEQSGEWGKNEDETLNMNTLYTISYNWETQSLAIK
jgi:hypothetical protein